MKVNGKLARIFQYLFYPIQLNTQNKLYDKEVLNSDLPPIYGVYHIYCIDSWKSLFQDQLNLLNKSELLNHTTKLYISVITKFEDDIRFIQSFDQWGKFVIINIDKEASKFEFPALEYIRSLSEKERFFVYYFHTKGVSITPQTFINYQRFHTSFSHLKKNSEYWRKMMEYWIFTKYNVALNVLSSGYDTYGAYLYECPKYSYYTGNFWWAKSSYIKNLSHFTDVKKKNRYVAETWLLSVPGKRKSYCPFYCISESYAVPLFPSMYKQIFSIKDIILFFYYHYRFCLYKLYQRIF